jgi:hypothetical protein
VEVAEGLRVVAGVTVAVVAIAVGIVGVIVEDVVVALGR